jgi:hypothetical protein
MAATITLTSLGLLAALGIALTYFAYELSRPLLTFAGTVGGIFLGLVAGMGSGPQVFDAEPTSGAILFFTITLVLFFGLLGYIFVPALGRLAFSMSGFVVTFVAALVALTEGQVLQALIEALPETFAEAGPADFIDRLAESPVFEETQFQQALFLAVVLAFLGAGLAMTFYDVVAGISITVVGAALLSAVVPLLVESVTGDVDLADGIAEVSLPWLLVFLVTGVAFQFVRYRNELDLGRWSADDGPS